MTTIRIAILAAALALCACNSADTKKETQPAEQPSAVQSPATPDQPLTREDSLNVTVTAKVKSVDLPSRRLTLVDPSGDEVSIVADRAVERLGEVRPGDTVTARYRATMLAELRPPTPAESAAPLAHVEVAGRAPSTQGPAAAAGEAIRAVTTVEAIDISNMLVTLRGPMGDLAVVRARNPDNIKRLRRGDHIVITFAHAVIVSLEKNP